MTSKDRTVPDLRLYVLDTGLVVCDDYANFSPSVASNTTRTRRGGTTVLGNRRGGVLQQLEADLVGSLISHRFEILYLAFTIACIGVCLSSRLLVPRARQAS